MHEVRVFHDDVRPPPEGWALTRDNAAAQDLLVRGDVVEISLDHDLGARPEDGINARGSSPDGDGLVLVRWMIVRGLVPARVTVHSWNVPRARQMVQELQSAGYRADYRPYVVP